MKVRLTGKGRIKEGEAPLPPAVDRCFVIFCEDGTFFRTSLVKSIAHTEFGLGIDTCNSVYEIETFGSKWPEVPSREDVAKHFSALMPFYMVGEEVRAFFIPKENRCKRCDGTGNELYSMYKQCQACGGDGVSKNNEEDFK